MKYSRQREVIKNVVDMNRIHPNADEVYGFVKQELPTISLATVYRNLNLLSEMCEIRRLTMPDGTYRFDGGMEPHQHAVCRKCGRVYDFNMNLTGFTQLTATGFEAEKCEVMVSGICNNCKNKN